MTKAGTFDEWMNDTYTLINFIQELGDSKWNIKNYNSPHFSYSYNGNNWIFKYNRVLEPMEDLRGSQTISQNRLSSWQLTAHTHVQGMSNSTRTTPGVNTVIIVLGGVNCNCIKSVQWIRKPNTGLTITSTIEPTFGQMEGGIVRGSFLFMPNMKILVDDKIYSNDTPEAFTQDISSDNLAFRYLDLLAFREKYDEQLY